MTTAELEAREAELDRAAEARDLDADQHVCRIHGARLDRDGDCPVCWIDDDRAYTRWADQ